MNKIITQVINCMLLNTKKGKPIQKSRNKIAYSNNKIRKQKGTGKARLGNRKNPLLIGGVKTFPGNINKNYKKKNK